jgi:hypothetical protein
MDAQRKNDECGTKLACGGHHQRIDAQWILANVQRDVGIHRSGREQQADAKQDGRRHGDAAVAGEYRDSKQSDNHAGAFRRGRADAEHGPCEDHRQQRHGGIDHRHVSGWQAARSRGKTQERNGRVDRSKEQPHPPVRSPLQGQPPARARSVPASVPTTRCEWTP